MVIMVLIILFKMYVVNVGDSRVTALDNRG